VALIEKFEWTIYLFGAILIFTGIKMALEKDKELHPEHNPVLKLFRRLMPVTKDYIGGKMLLSHVVKVPIQLALGVVLGTLALSIIISLVVSAKTAPE